MLLNLLASSPTTPAPLRESLIRYAMTMPLPRNSWRERDDALSMRGRLLRNPATTAEQVMTLLQAPTAVDRGVLLKAALERPNLTAAHIMTFIGADTTGPVLTAALKSALKSTDPNIGIVFEHIATTTTNATTLALFVRPGHRTPTHLEQFATERLAHWPTALEGPAGTALARWLRRAVRTAATRQEHTAAMSRIEAILATTTQEPLRVALTKALPAFTEPAQGSARWFSARTARDAVGYLNQNCTVRAFQTALVNCPDPTGTLAHAALDAAENFFEDTDVLTVCNAVTAHSTDRGALLRAVQVIPALGDWATSVLLKTLDAPGHYCVQLSAKHPTLKRLGIHAMARPDLTSDDLDVLATSMANTANWSLFIATHPNATPAQRATARPESGPLGEFLAHARHLDPANPAATGQHLPLTLTLADHYPEEAVPGLQWLASAAIAEHLGTTGDEQLWHALASLADNGFTGTLGEALDTATIIAA